MENSQTTGKVMGALLIGATVGSVLGLLFAPNKGSKTRKNIVHSTDDLAASIKQKFDNLFDEAKANYESQKEKAADYMSNKPEA